MICSSLNRLCLISCPPSGSYTLGELSFTLVQFSGGRSGHYTLLGGEFSCHVSVGRMFPLLVIHRVRQLSPSLLERQREECLALHNRFIFGEPPDEISSRR